MAQMHPRMQTKPHPEICLVDFDCWGHIRSNHIVRQVPWSCMCDRCLLREIANSKVEFFSGQDQSFCWPFAVYRETSWCFLWLYRLYHSTCIYIFTVYTHLCVFILLYIHMSLSYVFDLSHVDTYSQSDTGICQRVCNSALFLQYPSFINQHVLFRSKKPRVSSDPRFHNWQKTRIETANFCEGPWKDRYFRCLGGG